MLQRIKDKRMAQDEQGFTLIELLVVIIILGILAAVVVFAVGGVGDKGQRASCVIDTRTLRTAEEAYSAQPTTATPPGGGGYYGTMAQLTGGGFLSEASKYHAVTASVAPAAPTFAITVADTGCGNVSANVGTDGPAPGTPPADPKKPQNV